MDCHQLTDLRSIKRIGVEGNVGARGDEPPDVCGVKTGYKRCPFCSRNNSCLVFLRACSRRVERHKNGARDYLHVGDYAAGIDADDYIAARRGEFLIPDLQIVRLLNVDIEKLTGKTRLGSSETWRDRITERFTDMFFDILGSRSRRQRSKGEPREPGPEQ